MCCENNLFHFLLCFLFETLIVATVEIDRKPIASTTARTIMTTSFPSYDPSNIDVLDTVDVPEN